MEITLDNYEIKEKEILEDIQKCDFISFDLEMTGIAVNHRHFLDSPNERYQKHKYSAEKYKIIQLGLVPWFKKFDNDNKISYQAKPYNIYLFPSKDFSYLSNSPNINCEISALVFNSKHGMNFNTWINKGINYLNSRQYTNLVFKNKDNNINKYIPGTKKKIYFKKGDEIIYNEFEKKFLEFYNENNKAGSQFEYRKLPFFFLMNFINNIKTEILNNIYIIIDDINDKLYIKIVTPEEKNKLLQEDNKKYFEELEKSKGVKKIWDEIIKHQKIIIGHNLSIDILFCYSHLGETLPDDYLDFKNMAKTSFKGLYDTKVLYNNLAPKEDTKYDSSLDAIYEKLFKKYQNSIDVNIPEGFNDYINSEKKRMNETDQNSNIYFHQADFDAFITGLVFCYITNNFIDQKNLENDLQKYNWKIFFMKSFYKCFDLQKNEEFIVPNTIPYVLKSNDKNKEINLENVINDKNLYSLIKEKWYIEGINVDAMLILVDPNEGDLKELEKKLMENQNLFSVYFLDAFKQILREEEIQRKEKFKKYK